MTYVQAIVLAVVQGVTEFLPISSSGHLILVPHLFGWPDQGLAFDVATHVGTLAAVVVYFRRDLWNLIVGFVRPGAAEGEEYAPRRLAWGIVLGTVPAVVGGVLFKDVIASEARNALLVAGTSIGYGLVMAVADRVGARRREVGEVGLAAAVVIGCAQALALVPGT